MKKHNYWDRLRILKMQSIERRREQFIIIYMFKILNNLVPNPGVSFKKSDRNGVTANISIISTRLPCHIKNFHYQNVNFIGPRLFNILPQDLRNFTLEGDNIVLAFKNRLDSFLSSIPDQPTIYGMQRPANSNSVIDQIKYTVPC